MNNNVINIIAALIIIGSGSWFGFKSYINYHKASSEVEKSETISNNFDELNGVYVSQKTDPPTSEVLFETFGAASTQGTFKEVEITANFDGINSSIMVNINPASIYTAEAIRDDHLRGEEFFNVKEFTLITFKSSSLKAENSGFTAVGSLTFLGKTQDFEVPFVYSGSANNKENTEVFEGVFDLNPVIFGMEGIAGEKVTVSFYTELTKQM